MGKLSYITDPKLLTAICGACSDIWGKTDFDEAVKRYADKYGVDAGEVAKGVRKIQGIET